MSELRVLVSYHFGLGAIPLGEQVGRAFERAGCAVARFDSSTRPSAWDLPRRLAKSLSKVVGQKQRLAKHWERRNELATAARFRQAVAEFRPDLLLVIRGELIDPAAVAAAKVSWPVKAAVWWVKTMRWQGVVAEESTVYDAAFTIHRRLAADGVAHLPAFALDAERYHPAAVKSERWPLLFAGCWSSRRQIFLEAVADLPLTVVGPGWRKRLPRGHALLPRLGPEWVAAADLPDHYRQAGVVIDVAQIERRADEGETMRVADVPACGTVLLTEPTSGVAAHFQADAEVALFDSPAELRRQALDLLADPGRRQAMGRAAAIRAGQLPTFDDRVQTILQAVGLTAGEGR